MAVTLRDVAAAASVSPVVVSKVLHNRAQSIRVSAATADRVRKAADDLGYQCNVWARNFRTQKSQMVGVVHGYDSRPPYLGQKSRYFGLLMDGMLASAYRHGYAVTLCPKLSPGNSEDSISDGRFDGLIWYTSPSTDEMRARIARARLPLVRIHHGGHDTPASQPLVQCDNGQGVDLGLQHLFALGHREIAFVFDSNPGNYELVQRVEAFQKIMVEKELRSDRIIDLGPASANVDEFLSRKEDRPTAAFAWNEGVAHDLASSARRLGIRVPDDLSIIGYDSTSFCQEVEPRLTAVSQPLHAMGESAMDILIALIQGSVSEPRNYIFPCGLDIRESTTTAPVARKLL